MILGGSGGAKREWHGYTWPIDPLLSGVFLRQQWPCRVNLAGEATDGVWHPHRPLWPVQPTYKHEEDVKYGLSAMQCACQYFIKVIQVVDNRDRDNLPGESAAEDGMSKVRSEGRVVIATDAPSEPERHGLGGGAGGAPYPPPRRPKYTGSLSLNVYGGSSDQRRGSWEGLRIGPTFGFTLCTATCRTQ